MTHPDPQQPGHQPQPPQQPQYPQQPAGGPQGPQGPHGLPGPGGPPPGQYGAFPPGGMPPGGSQGPYGPQGQYPGQAQPKKSGVGVGLIIGAVVLVVLLIAGGGVLFAVLDSGDTGGTAPIADGGLSEVQHYEDLSAEHVEEGEAVEYDVLPPVGGEHYPTWQDCGVYEEPLRSEYAVHALEHGAVWITYDPELDRDEVRTLADLYSPGDYVLISPMAGLPAPVVASAWGSQIRLEGAEDPRLVEYLVQYVQGEDTPEPGAPCSGGFSGTEADVAAGSATSA